MTWHNAKPWASQTPFKWLFGQGMHFYLISVSDRAICGSGRQTWHSVGINHLRRLSHSVQSRQTLSALLEQRDSGLRTARGRSLACHETGPLFTDILQKTYRLGHCGSQALSIEDMMNWHQRINLGLLAKWVKELSWESCSAFFYYYYFMCHTKCWLDELPVLILSDVLIQLPYPYGAQGKVWNSHFGPPMPCKVKQAEEAAILLSAGWMQVIWYWVTAKVLVTAALHVVTQ